ncbi:(-)-germacrene D synthase-like isoform X2 [Vigna unguiculata]|uniref:(-)-germacrene D synthase-like isoform X2 n=1 Tax=Vigna unguiculata TaxID=3917 RepID=UPI001015E3CF|nr:(-)-germacrene D synthase-like isoform X2 [Vigna unguiculata]
MSLTPSSLQLSAKHAPPHITRPCANFSPSFWGDTFLQYHSAEIDDNMKQQFQTRKEEVKKMFLSSNNSILQKLNFIDSLQRLGISYHFQHEIDEALEQIYNSSTNDNVIIEEGCLHYMALLFRLLRQRGYHISSDIFNKFKNNKGDFDQNIAKDVQGLWSLFEASQLRIHGEDILDEALDFTHIHLKSLIDQMSASFAAQISHCLRKPLHKGVPRLEAKRYISFYEQNPSHCQVLLLFSKVDFNMLQKLHKIEVGSITKWWKDSEFATKVPYARERAVECYLWPIAMSYETEYSIPRKITSKLIVCISLLDDTYDAYGTIQELELLTQAIQRWDNSSIQSLPDSMKVVFNAIVEVCDEVRLSTLESEKSSIIVQCVKEAFYNLARAYLTEAKWSEEICVPTYEEYKDNGVISSTYPLMITSFLLLTKFSTQIDWILSNPAIIEAVSLIGRLGNDICSHKFEQQRMNVVSAVECCMKQYEISQEDAYKLIEKEIEDLWKVINEEYLKLDHVPTAMLDCILNGARITELAYENFEDKYTDVKLWKDDIFALLVNPISMEEPK